MKFSVEKILSSRPAMSQAQKQTANLFVARGSVVI